MTNGSTSVPLVSVIIPTHNRSDALRTTLESIAGQIQPGLEFEVIVADDGSTDETARIAAAPFPFEMIYLSQPWHGATAARNLGAQNSRGEILVFLDDDIELMPTALSALIEEQARQTQTIAIGTLLRNDSNSYDSSRDVRNEFVPFSFCFTGLLCVKRADFLALGMFQDPTGGWPNWDDIDFGYRAQSAGYRVLRVGRAQGIHHDLAVTSWESAARRQYAASKSAVRLFQRYPEIRLHLPMFRDKTPIDWRRDSAGLIARKLLRRITSTWLMLSGLRRIINFLEWRKISSKSLHRIHRWYVGGYMVQGYHDGLREYGSVKD
jgi:glycosyltransferase involved in cell wall biosynthesis